jgi:AraC family transcriptional regulator
MESRLGEDVALADLAREASLSPFHFARCFKAATGMSPHRYLVERRVERARDLLTGTDASLADVAAACGFCSQAHFTSAFKRESGITPGVFRAAERPDLFDVRRAAPPSGRHPLSHAEQ